MLTGKRVRTSALRIPTTRCLAVSRNAGVPLGAKLQTGRSPRPEFVNASRGFATAAQSSEIALTDPVELYQANVALGKIRYDPEQLRAMVQMRKLHRELLDYSPPIRLLTLIESIREKESAWPFKRSPMSTVGQDLLPEEVAERNSLLRLSDKERTKALVRSIQTDELETLETPLGFLLTGPPGTGKSLLMDMFFQSLPVQYKTRFHYHHFLLSLYKKIHDTLERHRLQMDEEERLAHELADKGNASGYGWSRREEMKALALSKGWRSVFGGGRSAYDPDLNTREFVLANIARDLIKEQGWLLAFDEVQLIDIAGAGLVSRVLSWYWRLGGIVIGTSNRVPQDLYNQGIQRETITSFLNALAARSPVIEVHSPLDYRREEMRVHKPTDSLEPGDFGRVEAWQRFGKDAHGWFLKDQKDEFDQAVKRVVGDAEGQPRTLQVYGRKLTVPWTYEGVAKYSFSQLCENANPLGPADYITIASNFHTLILTDIPVLPLSAKNEARRFITLIDSLYESKTRLLALAAAPIDDLCFPDAVNAHPEHQEAQQKLMPSPDDIVTSGGSAHPFSESRIYDADQEFVKRAPDSDSLTEEMLGDVLQDLEAPYRPNVASYDSTFASADEREQAKERARQAKAELGEDAKQQQSKREQPHPSASTPSFQSLAIFTGEEERFAFKRAVSRIHEMQSAEYLTTASWQPLDASLRTWERSRAAEAEAELRASSSAAQARHSVGQPTPLGDDRLSGAIKPSELRLKYSEGMPYRSRSQAPDDQQAKAPQDRAPRRRASKEDIMESRDPRLVADPPRFKEEHAWGVADWGKGSGRWGQGVKGYQKPNERNEE